MVHERAGSVNEVLLEPGQFLVLHIGNSKSGKTVSGDSIRTKDSQFWFFQVSDAAYLNEKPLRLFDSNGNPRGPIAAETGIDYSQLFDQNGDDTLRNNDEPWRVYHFGLGVQQDGVRVYPRVPEGQNGGGFSYLTGDEPDPTTPDPFGYVRSEETDIYTPSRELEGLAWRAGQRSVHQYGFYNENDVQVDPILSLSGAAYELRPVTERDSMLNLLADIGRPKAKQDAFVHTVNFSASALRTFSYDVPDEWKDAQNTLSVESANLPEEIEESIQQKEGGDN